MKRTKSVSSKKSTGSKKRVYRRTTKLGPEAWVLVKKLKRRIVEEFKYFTDGPGLIYDADIFLPRLRRQRNKMVNAIKSDLKTAEVIIILQKALAEVEFIHENAIVHRENIRGY